MTLKSKIRDWLNKKFLVRFGLELSRVKAVRNPWKEGDFAQIAAKVRPYTLLDPERLWVLKEGLKITIDLPGDVAEFGVYKGGGSLLLAHQIVREGILKTLHIFDSFEGFPEPDNSIDLHVKGQLGDTSKDSLSSLLRQTNCPFVIHEGFFKDTLPNVERTKWCFIHLDADLYSSVLEVLSSVWPSLSKGGIIVVDDYGMLGEPGVKKAVDEFSEKLGRGVFYLPSGQALLIKI
jgi:O-methyltransferase